jgi:hypothetical protein
MRALNVIIVASGRVSYGQASDLDELIRSIVALKKQPVLVLGPDGDDLLRSCEESESCEMIFDPNYSGNIFSSIKAGLEVCSQPAMVLPFAADWLKLERFLGDSGTSTHVLRPVTQNNEDTNGWPQIVTAHGVRELKNLPATTSWDDTEKILAKAVELPSETPT